MSIYDDVENEARHDWLNERDLDNYPSDFDEISDLAYDRYLADCEDLGLDPNSPISAYTIEATRWNFVPGFDSELDQPDIPF